MPPCPGASLTMAPRAYLWERILVQWPLLWFPSSPPCLVFLGVPHIVALESIENGEGCSLTRGVLSLSNGPRPPSRGSPSYQPRQALKGASTIPSSAFPFPP